MSVSRIVERSARAIVECLVYRTRYGVPDDHRRIVTMREV